MTQSALPDSVETVRRLYDAVSQLRDRAAETFSNFEDDGELERLTNDLAYIRDTANAIQIVAIAWAASLSENLR